MLHPTDSTESLTSHFVESPTDCKCVKSSGKTTNAETPTPPRVLGSGTDRPASEPVRSSRADPAPGCCRKTLGRGRLPTEVELAEQLGVSRETVRLAAEVLQREGLLVKIRRKGTFTTTPQKLLQLKAVEAKLLGYLQIDHRTMTGQEDAANRAISGLMLQGAIEEAGNKGYRLVAQRAPHTHLREAFSELYQHTQMSGVIFASYGEEKLLRRIVGLGLPALLLDHDLHLVRVNSVRDDSFEDARRAVQYLASLGHRRIAFAHWQQTELNPWLARLSPGPSRRQFAASASVGNLDGPDRRRCVRRW